MCGKVPIRFVTYNIRNGQKGGLEMALQGMSQATWTWESSRRQN